MNWSDWPNTKKTQESWRESVRGLEVPFAGVDRAVEKSRTVLKDGALWCEIRAPLDGVRLITAELRDGKLTLRVWVYRQATDLYDRFAGGSRFKIDDVPLPFYTEQLPRATWQSQLDAEGVALVGVRYVVALDERIDPDESSAGVQLRNLIASFCDYVNERAGLKSVNLQAIQAESLVMPDETLEDAARDILSIETDARFVGLGLPMRAVLANARVGQGGFRARMLALWGGKCSLTGCTTADVLIASHARAWSDCEGSHDCLDEYNGFLLTANVDRLFDRGQISFADDGTVLFRDGFDGTELIPVNKLRFVDVRHIPYLVSHRAKHGFG